MTDVSDLDLRPPGDEPEQEAPARRSLLTWWIVAALLVVAGSAGYFFYSRRAPAAPSQPSAATEPAATVAPRAGVDDSTPVEVPQLGDSDPFVRELARSLSSHPRIVAWLATRDLIRNVAVVVENVSSGPTPARHLRVLRPSAPFQVLERRGSLVIDPRSYQRYDGIADAVASLDTQGVARAYKLLRPRLDEAYRELGRQDSFDAALEAAIDMLLRTPVVEGDVRLVPAGALYHYADENLEGLTDAQKQFLRMGPRNVRLVQGKLGEIALALGIPAERLPAGQQ